MNEFQIIEKYFNRNSTRADVSLSVGDDCALLIPPKDKTLAVSIDALVENTHFFPGMSASSLGHKSLAISLSDLAAMGAEPAWVMLSLVLSEANERWLEEFSKSFYQLADRFNLNLIGGNISKGPLSITTQVTGFIDKENLLKRNQAKPSDLIYVSGPLGAAAAALKIKKENLSASDGQKSILFSKWDHPQPKIQLGLTINKFANAAIDISDGLIADLQHVLLASQVGALIEVEKIPVEPALSELFDEQAALQMALIGGEDYELCFTVPESKKQLVPEACICIGKIDNEEGLRVKYKTGKELKFDGLGYQHF